MLNRTTSSVCGWALLLVLFTGCSSQTTQTAGDGTETNSDGLSDPELAGAQLPESPDLPIPENTRERTDRLIRLEQTMDNWFRYTERQEHQKRESLENLLLSYTQDNLEAIISDLKHSAPRYRRVMAASLGFSSDPRAAGPLMDYGLKDTDPVVNEHALLSIYHLTRPRAGRPAVLGDGLREAPDRKLAERRPVSTELFNAERIAPFLQHPAPGVRSNAALALRPLIQGDEVPNGVLLALINAAEDKNDRTRVHAIAALGSTTSAEAVPTLVTALGDPVPLVRMRAALGIARHQDIQQAPYLIEVLEKENELKEVKKFVARALNNLLSVNSLSEDPNFWRDECTRKDVVF